MKESYHDLCYEGFNCSVLSILSVLYLSYTLDWKMIKLPSSSVGLCRGTQNSVPPVHLHHTCTMFSVGFILSIYYKIEVWLLAYDACCLQVYLEERAQEADSLTSRIQELEAQLHKEKEECKRYFPV